MHGQELRISERRACRVVGQARATQRYVPRESPDEQALVARMVALATPWGGKTSCGPPILMMQTS